VSLRRRLIACLDVTGGRVVKGTRFVDLVDAGDPVELAQRYAAEGADEIVILDIGATREDRPALLEIISRAAARLDVPLAVGGGVRSYDDAAALLDAGADKVGINSAALARPALITEIAERLGGQSVVVAIDALRAAGNDGWLVRSVAGTRDAGRDAVEWAREAVDRGCGEILLTSIDRDGTRAGYDVALTRAVADAVSVPVIASAYPNSSSNWPRAAYRSGRCRRHGRRRRWPRGSPDRPVRRAGLLGRAAAGRGPGRRRRHGTHACLGQPRGA
jgi:cyclase